MAGPTGGYLLGYFAASWVIGTLAKGRGTFGRVAAMLAGLVVTYVAGLAWLGFYVPSKDILALGFVPFILGDLVKIAFVATGAAMVSNRFFRKTGR